MREVVTGHCFAHIFVCLLYCFQAQNLQDCVSDTCDSSILEMDAFDKESIPQDMHIKKPPTLLQVVYYCRSKIGVVTKYGAVFGCTGR